jgi:hypothetical protein
LERPTRLLCQANASVSADQIDMPELRPVRRSGRRERRQLLFHKLSTGEDADRGPARSRWSSSERAVAGGQAAGNATV